MNAMPPPDLDKLRTQRDQARDLLTDPAFQHGCEQLEKLWQGELYGNDALLTARKVELIAMLKTLRAITRQIQAGMNDYTMAQRRTPRHG